MENKYTEAKYLASQKQFEKALEIVEELIKKRKTSKYLLLKGKILANLEQFEEASVCLVQINEQDMEWKEARVVLAKVNKLKNSKIRVWYYKNLNRKIVGIRTLLVLVIIISVVFASMYFADKNDPQLRESVQSISLQSDKIFENIIILKDVIERNNQIRQSEVREIKSEIIFKNLKLNHQLDSIHRIDSQSIATLKLLLEQNEKRMNQIEILLEELKTKNEENRSIK